MDKLRNIKNQIACEINQKDLFQKNVIVQILCSKRLLSDHLASLEEVANDYLVNESGNTNHITFLSTSSAMIASYGIFHFLNNNIRYLIPCITGAIPVMYLHKQMQIGERMVCESQMKEFIKSLDDFEFHLRKCTNFINDAQYIKEQANNLKRASKNRNISLDIFNVTKRVVRALYCFLKYLEMYYKIDEKYLYSYEEIDDVDNCKLLTTDFENEDPQTMHKQMFNLFAYVQSHLLLRIGFIFSTNIQEGKSIIKKKKLYDITNKIKYQTSLLPTFLILQKEGSDLQNNIQKLIDNEMCKTVPKELVNIRSSTVEFTLKVSSLISNLKDYQEMLIQLPNNYQNANKPEMDDVMKYLEAIGCKLSDCSDEHNRMLILMKKYYNKDTEEAKVNVKEVEKVEKPLKIAEENPEQSDDFFYVDPDKENMGENVDKGNQESNGPDDDDLDEENLQIKLTKKCFKPVLAQLKERIVTIDADMKEREKKVLKEKGIEITEHVDKFDLEDYDSDNDADWKRQKKFDRNRQKYDQNREFLQAKGPINLLSPGKFPVMNSFISLNEEILE